MAGSIQGDINQALGTLGVLATFSPQLQEHAENIAESRKLNKKQEALEKQAAATGNKPLEPQIADDISNQMRDVARRKFELKPSEKTYKEYAKKIPTIIREDPEMIHQERMEAIPDIARRNAEYAYNYQKQYKYELDNLEKQDQAMASMTRQKAAKATRRNFIRDYLAQQPTSFGGTVGDLSPDLQKKIASQYDRNARRRMMNQMDREARNGK